MLYRNKRLLETVRNFPCQHCGKQDGTVVAAHSNQLRDGKGKGIKASDYRVASLCFMCHAELDRHIGYKNITADVVESQTDIPNVRWLKSTNYKVSV